MEQPVHLSGFPSEKADIVPDDILDVLSEERNVMEYSGNPEDRIYSLSLEKSISASS